MPGRVPPSATTPMAELLVLPALIAYGEAAFAYAGELRGSARYGRLGIWGVRIGWLAQTALLAVQALSADGFPWGTWAGALNFLSWLVVSGYLIWGCKPRYRLVGLGVMPVAAGLLVLAWAGGGTAVDESDGDGWALAVHAGPDARCVRELPRGGRHGVPLPLRGPGAEPPRHPPPAPPAPVARGARAPLRRAPFSPGSLLLSGGILVGLAWLDVDGLDAAMTVTIAIWVFYGLALLLRREAGLQGRRLAWTLVAGAVLVAVVLPLTHFAA